MPDNVSPCYKIYLEIQKAIFNSMRMTKNITKI